MKVKTPVYHRTPSWAGGVGVETFSPSLSLSRSLSLSKVWGDQRGPEPEPEPEPEGEGFFNFFFLEERERSFSRQKGQNHPNAAAHNITLHMQRWRTETTKQLSSGVLSKNKYSDAYKTLSPPQFISKSNLFFFPFPFLFSSFLFSSVVLFRKMIPAVEYIYYITHTHIIGNIRVWCWKCFDILRIFIRLHNINVYREDEVIWSVVPSR